MKPYVICHMCTTIDGRILGERWGRLPRVGDGAKLFETTAASFGIGAWLVGNTTMKEFAGPPMRLPPTSGVVDRKDHVAEAGARRFAIGADAKGVLRFREPEVNGDHIVVLVSEQVSDAYLTHLRAAGVSYLFCGRSRVDVRRALRKIGERLGLRELMLEGGGTFNGSALAAGAIDEISQVIVPIADGGAGIASVFDIPGPAPRMAAARLRLLQQRTLPGGIIWLRYRVLGKRLPGRTRRTPS
jgi:2,5-diamino-6-(ribosylamino)-4(3H)-pyrimidinone 5'-phosphate reductase